MSMKKTNIKLNIQKKLKTVISDGMKKGKEGKTNK